MRMKKNPPGMEYKLVLSLCGSRNLSSWRQFVSERNLGPKHSKLYAVYVENLAGICVENDESNTAAHYRVGRPSLILVCGCCSSTW